MPPTNEWEGPSIPGRFPGHTLFQGYGLDRRDFPMEEGLDPSPSTQRLQPGRYRGVMIDSKVFLDTFFAKGIILPTVKNDK